ncbi:MBL fold metallo-hydrolase [bacterium]|nr:MBL fold metallo-hydrolase [bacterium]
MLRFKDLSPETLYFVPLGGSDEIGMNANLYIYQGKAIMVDLGIGFAHEDIAGVDVLVPDLAFMEELGPALQALIITHAHEDHIGAIAYLADAIRCPIYASPLAKGIIDAKLVDNQSPYKLVTREYQADTRLTFGPFSIEFEPITHSIPEMHAVIIHTDKGTVFHTGDWKLDPQPVIGKATDSARLKAIGEKGVLALVCDSTNVFVEGESGSEGQVAEALPEVIAHCKGRVVMGTFATNVARVDSICAAAKAAGRHVALVGRSLWRTTEAARESGYLTQYPPFLTDKQAMELPRHKVLILATGCQGEGRAALSRIAHNDHPVVRLSAGDTVCFSSRDIPGNHVRIGMLQNALVRNRIEVITSYDAPIHVSGHPAREELRQLYGWLKPKIAIPTHGEARHLHKHAALARELGVPETVEAFNGAVIQIAEGQTRITGQVQAGYYAVDGSSLLPLNGDVLKTRARVRDNGAVFISLLMDDDDEMDIRISAPGLLDAHEDRGLIDELRLHLEEQALTRRQKQGEAISKRVEQAARRFLERECDKRPYVIVHMLG